MPLPSSASRGVVLLVDDEPMLLRAVARCLGAAGFEVMTAGDGSTAAVELIRSRTFDTIVSDIGMPRMNGIQLLRVVRQRDLDLPVILMTGEPELATAAEAVGLGALLYLVKPVGLADLEIAVTRAVRLNQIARLKREALALMSGGNLGGGDRVGLEASFDRALATLWMAFQPIVRTTDRSMFAYEALLRSDEPALPHPGVILDAAERLGRLDELGQSIRASAAGAFSAGGGDALLFVNLHARDLLDPALYSGGAPLSALARRVVLEITERASLDGVPDVRERVATLRSMGFRIAIDDLGAGYAGLTSFAMLEPEFVKLDMSLIRGVDREPTKQKLVGAMTALCKDLGMAVVAEGVETPHELDTLVGLGCDLAQGYFFARPARAFLQA